jgi:hypothetical protein
MCEHVWKCQKCGEEWKQPGIVGECGRAIIGLERYAMSVVPWSGINMRDHITFSCGEAMRPTEWKVVKIESFDQSSSSSSLTSDSSP